MIRPYRLQHAGHRSLAKKSVHTAIGRTCSTCLDFSPGDHVTVCGSVAALFAQHVRRPYLVGGSHGDLAGASGRRGRPAGPVLACAVSSSLARRAISSSERPHSTSSCRAVEGPGRCTAHPCERRVTMELRRIQSASSLRFAPPTLSSYEISCTRQSKRRTATAQTGPASPHTGRGGPAAVRAGSQCGAALAYRAAGTARTIPPGLGVLSTLAESGPLPSRSGHHHVERPHRDVLPIDELEAPTAGRTGAQPRRIAALSSST